MRFTTIEWMCDDAKMPHWLWERMNAARTLTFRATNLIPMFMGTAKNSGKAILSRMLFFWLLFLTHPVMATQMREGWVLQEGSEPPTWIFGEREAVIMVGKIAPGEAAKPIALVQKLDVPGVCPGLSTAPASKLDNGKISITTVQSSSVECAVASRMDAQSGIMVFAFQVRGSKADALNYAKSIMYEGYEADNDEHDPQKMLASQQLNQPVGIGEGELKQMIAAVPAANLPIGFLMVSTSRIVGTQLLVLKEPWLVFGNGYATDCYNWDPRKTAPTPQNLETQSCSVLKWRKLGQEIQTQGQDGRWNDPEELEQGSRFQPGERVTFAVEGWNSVGGSLPGGSSMPYAQMSVDRVNLQNDGTITFGADKQIWSGGNHSSIRSGIRGNYYVDNYLMAVGIEGGAQRLHFVLKMKDVLGLDGQFLGPDRK